MNLRPVLAALFGITVFPCIAVATDLTGHGSASVSSGDAYDSVYGSLAQGGDAVADGSRVTVTGGTISEGLYGGSAQSGNGSASADGNSVSISGGMSGFDYEIYGGHARSDSSDASARNNSVVIGGSLSLGQWATVIGGSARESSGSGGRVTATGNRVEISGGTSLYRAVGGEAYGESDTVAIAHADGNAVTVNGGAVILLYGGTATSNAAASANDNAVTVNGGVLGEVVGGEAYSRNGAATADGNSVTIRGGITGDLFGGSVQSDTVAASASRNTIRVVNAAVGGNISGGFAPMSTVAAMVGHNTIIVGSGAVVKGNVHGGDVTGSTEGSQADFNTLVVTGGGKVGKDLYGGRVEAAGSASHNTILVESGSVGGDIYGGDGGPGGTARLNSVIIDSRAILSAANSLYGGAAGTGNPVAAAGSGNILFVDSWQGNVRRVAGFEHIYFVLPTPGAPVDVPMLTVTGAQPDDFRGTSITAQLPDILAGGKAHIGETFTLVRDDSGAVAQAYAGKLVSLQQGYAVFYDGILVNTGTGIQLDLTGIQLNPRVAALNEARAASAGVLNQGADLTAGAGLRQAREAALHADERTGWAVFGTMYGGTTRYHTGSRADAEGLSLMTGVTRNLAVQQGDLLFGAFFEFGRAHLNTFSGFAAGNVNGTGTSRYTGGGLLARFDAGQGPLSGWYAEGSLRMGLIDTSWRSGDLRDNMDRPAEYDVTAMYYGGHAGLGRIVPLGDALRADVYGKFFLAHQNGRSVDMNGEDVDFDAVDSRRFRLGARLEYTLADGITPYAGGAWERELDGTARAVAQGFAIPSASLKGNSGIFELGLNMEPKEYPLDIDIVFQGSAGVRDSLGGSLNVACRF